MDLTQFAVKMKKRAGRLAPNVAKVKQKVALEVLKVVAESTPVDSGTAISNWQVGINSTEFSVLPAFYPGNFGSTDTENIRATIAAGTTRINAAKSGQVIHITNIIAYIGELNSGSSKQAPRAFVQKAVIRGLGILKTAKVIED